MAVRETLWSLVESTLDAVAEVSRSATGGAREKARRAQESLMDRLRERVEAIEQQLDGIDSLRERVAALEPTVEPEAGDAERLQALEERIAKVDKRLQMAMAAIQAATTQLMEVKDATATARNQAQQANQRATSAHTAAEAAADGVSAVEEAMAGLAQRLEALHGSDVEGDALGEG